MLDRRIKRQPLHRLDIGGRPAAGLSERLHAPEYQLITPAGRTYSRTRYLEMIKAEAFYAALDEAFQDHWEHHSTPFAEWYERQAASPNFDSSCAVWIDSCVTASTPGVSRVIRAAAAGDRARASRTRV